MNTLKIKTTKEVVSIEDVDTDLKLPAFFKSDKDRHFTKIISEKEGAEIHLGTSYRYHDSDPYLSQSDIAKLISEGTEITEDEWQDAVNKYSESVDAFVESNLLKSPVKCEEEIITQTNA